jgi:hypothetical protein
MSVSAETYIVISLMFAVFAAVAAIGTSVVLGAGFERLRAGFEVIKNQSGFFADAIYKLDIRTEQLGEETAKLKAGMVDTQDRVGRVEKQTSFMADELNELSQRILSGTPTSPDMKKHDGTLHADGLAAANVVAYKPAPTQADMRQPGPSIEKIVEKLGEVEAKQTDREALLTGLFRDNEVEMLNGKQGADEEISSSEAPHGSLFARYFHEENNRGVIYH